MSFGSIEGLLISLLLIVPGGLGIELRTYLWSGRSLTPFEELLRAVSFSISALALCELGGALISLCRDDIYEFGDFLLNEITRIPGGQLASDPSWFWSKFGILAGVAIALPTLFRWLRGRPLILKLKPVKHLSLHSKGFEALFEESIHEARGWEASWAFGPGEYPWLTVEMTDGRSFRGQMMWRSTAPDPPELVLINVSDVTDDDDVFDIPGLVLLGAPFISRLWIMKPEGRQAPSERNSHGPDATRTDRNPVD
jgi:Family of unknown function (DUF6338)